MLKQIFLMIMGLHISQLTSDSAYIDQKTNNLYAYGNVIVT